jgi:stearoyl-CoA desaturase (Delta-9 desaturase)
MSAYWLWRTSYAYRLKKGPEPGSQITGDGRELFVIKPLDDYSFGTVIPFVLLHLGCIAVFFVPFHSSWVVLMLAIYAVRMFGITAGYHRYFSHRSYKLARGWQFLMAFLAETSGQKGVLWWAAHHRVHHRHADQDPDVHSPLKRGFWWAHVGWVLSNEYDKYDPALIRDFGKYPELRWLDKHYMVPPIALAALLLLCGGLQAFVWGFVVSTVLLFHGTFTINSVAHLWGSRRFDTADDSRNNFVLAIITLGEGWHNNHHKFMYACQQGLRWWEVDVTFYALKMLNWLGIARDLRGIRLPLAEGEAR